MENTCKEGERRFEQLTPATLLPWSRTAGQERIKAFIRALERSSVSFCSKFLFTIRWKIVIREIDLMDTIDENLSPQLANAYDAATFGLGQQDVLDNSYLNLENWMLPDLR